MSQKKAHLLPILRGQPVIPVLLVEKLDDAAPLARALVRGGIKAVEVTLRTPAALDCIRAIADTVPEVTVGAGTVLDATQFEAAEKAGAQFIVSPGLTAQLIEKADASRVPLLPGAITPGEIMAAREKGYDILKFFPAEQAGGMDYVKALASPFAGVTFCPTGGISLSTAARWLALPNVICVGGSWLAPRKLIQAGQWDAITALATETSQLQKA
jgi:2-dehydro-3-deoxyphosphogluconate aldolase/(4S)-4-hydroxy-2-oxoglutarate aldolase